MCLKFPLPGRLCISRVNKKRNHLLVSVCIACKLAATGESIIFLHMNLPFIFIKTCKMCFSLQDNSAVTSLQCLSSAS